MLLYLIIAVLGFVALVFHTRRVGGAFGLPIAYLFSLLLQHLPGGLAHLTGGYFFSDSTATEIGLRFTALGTVAFVTGVVVAQRASLKTEEKTLGRVMAGGLALDDCHALGFAKFCLLGGWAVVAVASFLRQIPSLGAAVDQAGSVWILGVLIGLFLASKQRRMGLVLFWFAALAVYPTLVLVNGGFLSFGSTSVMVVMASLLVSTRSHFRAYMGLVLFSVFCLCVFMSYFQTRDRLREVVWGGSDFNERFRQSTRIITQIRWFDPANELQLIALDQRLNQNFFVGTAAQRIESGQVDLVRGNSIVEGIQALVPRAIWPEKPTFAGSSQMIRDMCGFIVNENTSYGVGQVMEFYINFGLPSLIGGFLLFGFFYGWIDHKAGNAFRRHDYGDLTIWFLLAISILSPLASVAEIFGNVAAAFVGALGWRWLWRKMGSTGKETEPTETRKVVSGRHTPWQGRVTISTGVAGSVSPSVACSNEDNVQ
jgi:hypothetical protein